MKPLLKLKQMKKFNLLPLLIVLFLGLAPQYIMAQDVAEKPILSLHLKYYNDNNISQHIVVDAKAKIDRKFQQIAHIPVLLYITSDANKNNFIGKGVTNDKGQIVLFIPPSAKAEWMKSPNQTFIAVSTATKIFDEAKGELAITKAKLKIDTTEGRMIHAKVLALVDTTWTPISAVDVIIGVKRLGGILNANETATYPTDSAGGVTAEFKRDTLPGDTKGNLVLVASVVDNDSYGNLTAEMEVPWGNKLVYTSNFDHRSLFARRGHSPLWLEFLAYGIVIVVWFVILYLFVQIKNIKKLGVE
jgi:hypothetical protein